MLIDALAVVMTAMTVDAQPVVTPAASAAPHPGQRGLRRKGHRPAANVRRGTGTLVHA